MRIQERGIKLSNSFSMSSWYQSTWIPFSFLRLSIAILRPPLMSYNEHPIWFVSLRYSDSTVFYCHLLLPTVVCIRRGRLLLLSFTFGCYNSYYKWIPLSVSLPSLKVGANILNIPFVGQLATYQIIASPYMILLTRHQTSFNPIRFNHNLLMRNIKNISS